MIRGDKFLSLPYFLFLIYLNFKNFFYYIFKLVLISTRTTSKLMKKKDFLLYNQVQRVHIASWSD